MKLKFILFFILAGMIMAFTLSSEEGHIVKKEDFQKFIDTLGLTFTMPAGYSETYVKENRDLWYSFAMKDKHADFEVRYSIWSLTPDLAEYEASKGDSNRIMINPNVFYKGRIQANVLNMTSGQDWAIDPFPTQAVKNEFNADAGGSSFFEFNSEFGKGYNYGQMVYLHKDNVADVIITYLSNDKTTHSDLMQKSFYALKFK